MGGNIGIAVCSSAWLWCIAAPTGLAAFNVGGVTNTHRLFQLPIKHKGKQAGYWSLSKAAQKVMRSTFRSLKMMKSQDDNC